jgi:hypothetical protein
MVFARLTEEHAWQLTLRSMETHTSNGLPRWWYLSGMVYICEDDSRLYIKAHFAKCKEACGKYVELAFGVVQ